MNNSALLVIDVQNDFCPGGSLAVNDSDRIIPVINKIKEENLFKVTIQTSDWHPQNHVSFACNHEGQEPFTTIQLQNGKQQELWPIHCVQQSKGSELHKDLLIKDDDMLIKKGQNPNVDSYSGFGSEEDQTQLKAVLESNQIKKCFVVGLATDFCVFYTAMDSQKFGFQTYVIKDAIKGISNDQCKQCFTQMQQRGIKIIDSQDIKSLIQS